MCLDGATFQEIADALGISRQRAYQLVHHAKGKELGLPRIRSDAARHRAAMSFAGKRERLFSKFGVELRYKDFTSDVLRAEQYHRLLQKKANCKSSGIEFSLTWGDLDWPINCPAIGIPIDYYVSAGGRSENSCSFDRIDSTQGYVKGNVRVISWRANRIKNDGTAAEHRSIAEYIDKYS